MKLKNLTLALLLTIAGTACVHAQDSTATQTTTTTTSVTEEPTRPDYMKIYGWAGGIFFAIIAIGVISVEIKNMRKADEEEKEQSEAES